MSYQLRLTISKNFFLKSPQGECRYQNVVLTSDASASDVCSVMEYMHHCVLCPLSVCYLLCLTLRPRHLCFTVCCIQGGSDGLSGVLGPRYRLVSGIVLFWDRGRPLRGVTAFWIDLTVTWLTDDCSRYKYPIDLSLFVKHYINHDSNKYDVSIKSYSIFITDREVWWRGRQSWHFDTLDTHKNL